MMLIMLGVSLAAACIVGFQIYLAIAVGRLEARQYAILDIIEEYAAPTTSNLDGLKRDVRKAKTGT